MRLRFFLFHILFDGSAQIVDGLLVALAGGVHNTVLQMILKDDLAGIVDGGAHGGNLNQHLGTVAAFLDHAFYGLQMADGAGEAVQHSLGVFVGMAVMTVDVPGELGVGKMIVRMLMLMDVIAHGFHLFEIIVRYAAGECNVDSDSLLLNRQEESR